MEFLGVQQPFTQFQEEKYQMLELNQRLESYLGRVKLLEEENKLLREEIHTLKNSRELPGQRKAQDEALIQARRMVEEAWRKKDRVELEMENLMEDVEMVSIQRQKAKAAQSEAQRKLMESKKELEEERRAQIWLKEKVGQLEKDLLLQMQVHQEDMETLQASLKQTKQVLIAPQHTQTTSIPDLEQKYSHRAAQAWQEATNNFQRQVGRLEESLNQAKANMAKIHEEKREKQHQVQHLAKELESTKTKRQMLEKHVVQQREEQIRELQHLQAQVDALELEKDSIGQQIDSLMVEKQNLLQVKMSLGLEVATYRTLLDSEGMRIDRPTTKKTNSAFFLDALSKPTGTHQTLSSIAASCHFSNTVSTSHRSVTPSLTLLTSATPSLTPSQGTPQRTPTKTSVPEKTVVQISEETKKAAEDDLDREQVHEDEALVSTAPRTVAEPEPQLKPENIKVEDEPKQFQNTQMVESKPDESALISVSADQLSSLSQTPETESWGGPLTDSAGVLEEGKDEDIEVSVEMARISHAPKVGWEENKTVAEDEKDDASEMDVSENISETHTVAYGDTENENYTLTSSLVSPNTNILADSFPKQGALGDFGYQEEANEDLMRVDKQDIVSNNNEEVTEQMNSETEAEIDSINDWDRQEEIEPENEMNVMSPESEVEEEGEISIGTGMKDKTEDENVTEKEYIEVIERDIPAWDGGVDSPKNIYHQEIIEKTVPSAEAHSVQTVNEGHPLPEESAEEEENQGYEDSPNISASLRTDPGECDSYSQENTLADTRPLICYKSDEETEGNVQASHLIGETSGDEKERADGGHWNESTSKRFNTMEDLTEEQDMDVTGEMMTDDVVSKEELDDDRACMMLQSGSGVQESWDVEKEMPRIDLRGNLEEDTDDYLSEIRRDEYHDEKINEQNVNPQQTENQHIYTEKLEYETGHSYESQEHVEMDHPSSFSETSQEEQLESSFEPSPTLTMFQDAATTKEPENVHVSMHTNMDLMDSHSLASKINRQPSNTLSGLLNSDQEECNSSDDESPNASQCFQNTSLLAAATLTKQPLTFTNGVFKADSVSDNNNVPEEVLSKEKGTEEAKTSQIYDWGDSNIWGKSTSIPDAASIDENSGVFPVNETGNETGLGSPNKMPSVTENIFGKFEEHFERTPDNFTEKLVTSEESENNNSGEEEEFQSKEKKSEIHSFFSTTLKEDFWSKGKAEMAATHEPAKTEDLNQAMVFGEEWKDERMPAANGNPKEEMDILKGRDEKHQDEQPTEGKIVSSDDSVGEGDSWSSGDE